MNESNRGPDLPDGMIKMTFSNGKTEIKSLADLVISQSKEKNNISITDEEMNWIEDNCDPEYIKRMRHKYNKERKRIKKREKIFNKDIKIKEKQKNKIDEIHQGKELMDNSLFKSDDYINAEHQREVIFLYNGLTTYDKKFKYDKHRSKLYNKLVKKDIEEEYNKALINESEDIKNIIKNNDKNKFYYLVVDDKYNIPMIFKILIKYDNFEIITRKKAKKIKKAIEYDKLTIAEKRHLEEEEQKKIEEEYNYNNYFYPFILSRENPKKYKKLYGKNGEKEQLTKKEKDLLKFFKSQSKINKKNKKKHETKTEKYVRFLKKELKSKGGSLFDKLHIIQEIKDYEDLFEYRNTLSNKYTIFKNPNKKFRKRVEWEKKQSKDKREIVNAAVDFCLEKLIEDPFSPDRFKNDNIVVQHNQFINEKKAKKNKKEFIKLQKKDLAKYEKKERKKIKKKYKKIREKREKEDTWTPYSKKEKKILKESAYEKMKQDGDKHIKLKDGELSIPLNEDILFGKKYSKTLKKLNEDKYGKNHKYTLNDILVNSHILDKVNDYETKKEYERKESMVNDLLDDKTIKVNYEDGLDVYLKLNGF